jgi:glycine betaine/proline transport system substrate-binding protein
MRRKFLIFAMIMALFAAACGDDDDGGGDISGTITMARANWDTGYFQAEVYRQMLEELGYTVTPPEDNELSAELFYTAVNEGEVDFWVNGWFTLHDDFLAAAPNATRIGNEIAAGGFQGYLVDKATAEANGIESIEQIDADPSLAGLFDVDGDGVGDLVGCNAGWGCHEAINQHFTEQSFSNLQHLSAEYSVLMADVIARHDRGEPVLYYTWTPNWTVGALVPGVDVVWINAGTHPNGQSPVSGVEGCVTDPCDIGWTANDINVVAYQDFLDDNPAAAELFRVVELPLGAVSDQNLKMNDGESTQADIERHATDWIAANRALVDQWLEAARAAA